jgi:hypothetical protein
MRARVFAMPGNIARNHFPKVISVTIIILFSQFLQMLENGTLSRGLFTECTFPTKHFVFLGESFVVNVQRLKVELLGCCMGGTDL